MTSPGMAGSLGNRFTMATTPSPKAISTRVPRNSAINSPNKEDLLVVAMERHLPATCTSDVFPKDASPTLARRRRGRFAALAHLLPNGRVVANPKHRTEVEDLWGI